mmetsp:Transcript_85736/g.188241  ORF Transcript_85736/g.188241 Transcript_85736/m.188241 type:complete len:748 (-) Transcript_85736:481-2724(-)
MPRLLDANDKLDQKVFSSPQLRSTLSSCTKAGTTTAAAMSAAGAGARAGARGASAAARAATPADADSLLFDAVRRSSCQAALQALQQGAAPNAEGGPNSSTALHLAAASGSLELVRLLSDSGADINKPSSAGATPVFVAAHRGRSDVVRWLAQSGADLEAKTRDGAAPLLAAAQEGHEGVVRLLCEAGVCQDGAMRGGWTALCLAALRGHLDVVEILTSSSILSNNRGKRRRSGVSGDAESCSEGEEEREMEEEETKTATTHREEKRKERMYEAEDRSKSPCRTQRRGHRNNCSKDSSLCSQHNAEHPSSDGCHCRQAALEQATREGVTPLLAATQGGHHEVVDLLLQRGANGECRRKDGSTPLLVAAHGGHVHVIKRLVNSRVDLNARASEDRGSTTALFVAAQRGHTAVVRYLCEEHAELDLPNSHGATPLCVAAQRGHLDIVRILVESGADKDRATDINVTPLFVAAQSGHEAIVKYLVDSGANKEKELHRGTTPLFVAAQNGHLACVRVLALAGADTEKIRWDGSTPLAIAAHNGHADIARYLRGPRHRLATPLLSPLSSSSSAASPLCRLHDTSSSSSPRSVFPGDRSLSQCCQSFLQPLRKRLRCPPIWPKVVRCLTAACSSRCLRRRARRTRRAPVAQLLEAKDEASSSNLVNEVLDGEGHQALLPIPRPPHRPQRRASEKAGAAALETFETFDASEDCSAEAASETSALLNAPGRTAAAQLEVKVVQDATPPSKRNARG